MLSRKTRKVSSPIVATATDKRDASAIGLTTRRSNPNPSSAAPATATTAPAIHGSRVLDVTSHAR